MDKQLLAKMYIDTYLNADDSKSKRYGQQILDMADFGEVYVESQNITVTHQLVWYHRLLTEKQTFPISATMRKGDLKKARKIWAESVLFDKIARAETVYENCKAIEGYKPHNELGAIYSAMGYYYTPTDEGKESVRKLVERAKQHGLDNDVLLGLLSCPAVPEDLLAELELAEQKQKKLLAIGKMLLPVDFELQKGKKTLQVLKTEPLTDDYLKEVFKNEILDCDKVPEKAKQAIDEGSIAFKSQLVYAPSRFTKWTSEPAVYNWRYSPSEGYSYWGTYTYGGASHSEKKPATLQPLVNGFIDKTLDNTYGFDFVEGKDNFMAEAPVATVPAEIIVHDQDARKAFIKAKKIDDWMISEFSCQVPAKYDYENVYVYCPVYYLWMMAGDYAIKAVLDGCNPTHIEIWEVAKIENAEDITFYISKSKANEQIRLRDRTTEKKTAKRVNRNSIVNSILFVLSLIPTILSLLSKGEAIVPSIVAGVAILIGFAGKGLAFKKSARTLCTIMIVIAFIASLLLASLNGVFAFSSSGSN